MTSAWQNAPLDSYATAAKGNACSFWKVRRSCRVRIFPPPILWQLVMQITLGRTYDGELHDFLVKACLDEFTVERSDCMWSCALSVATESSEGLAVSTMQNWVFK